jgi:hypothetical protein
VGELITSERFYATERRSSMEKKKENDESKDIFSVSESDSGKSTHLKTFENMTSPSKIFVNVCSVFFD